MSRELGELMVTIRTLWIVMEFLGNRVPPSLQISLPEFRCPSPCDTRRFPHYDSCQFYWQCSLDCQHTRQTCSSGQHFSYDRQSCEAAHLNTCNKYSFRCSWSLPASATASCSNDTAIAVSRVDLLQVNKARCPDTVPDNCCAIPLMTCNVTSHREQTERARTACDGGTICSVNIDPVNLASGCVTDAFYLYYRCLYIADSPQTTATDNLFTTMGLSTTTTTSQRPVSTSGPLKKNDGLYAFLVCAVCFSVVLLLATAPTCIRKCEAFINSKKSKHHAATTVRMTALTPPPSSRLADIDHFFNKSTEHILVDAESEWV